MPTPSSQNGNSSWQAVSHRPRPYSIKFTTEEINSIEEWLCSKFRWEEAHSFQLKGIRAQLQGQDAIIHVATSMGKTAVAAGPFVLDRCSKLIIIYIIPLLALQDEMAVTFPKEFGVSAVAINSQVTTSNKDLIRCIHPLDTYRDVGFVIPPGVKEPTDIPKFFIYADSIEDGTGIVTMELFWRGKIRGLVCTDAAGMWKSTNSIESFHQCAGCVARNKTHKGIAILLAEPNAYKVDPTELANINTSNPNARTKYTGRPSHGTKKKSSNSPSGDIEIHENSPGGGIYAFIQTTSCRRAVLTRVFNNPEPVLSLGVPCCDICDPSVLDKVRVPPPKKKCRAVKAKRGLFNAEIFEILVAWREKICERDFSHLQWAPNAFLDDETIHSIASWPDAATGTKLPTLLEKEWGYWSQYGGELIAHLKQESKARDAARDLPETPQVDMSGTQGPGTKGIIQAQRRGSRKGPTDIDAVTKQNHEEGEPQTTDLGDASQALEVTASSEVKEQSTGGKKSLRSIGGFATVNPADSGLIRIAPASPHSQWRVSTTPMLPAQMTPIIPLQKRAKSPDPSQSAPRKLQFN
ncbi:hypothetical protein FRC11_005158 [Ceratobasidium sp. 423]|nr:hypothetical protein FRC11_005158 [Ceratobasidium sp. 423]